MMMKTRFFSSRRSAKDHPEPSPTTNNNNSERSVGSGMIIDSERTAVSAIQSDGDIDIDIDIDFSVTESGRTVAHLGVGTTGVGGPPLPPPPTNDLVDDDVDFSITSSGRTIERIMQEQAQASAAATTTTTTTTTTQTSQQMAPGAVTTTTVAPAAKATTTTPLVPAATVTISNPLTILPSPSPSALTTSLNSASNTAAAATTMKSPSRPIPQNRHGSEDSTGSAFLSGILNTTHNNSSNNQQQHVLSHTPPTAYGTSYENKHFGKRQRSGSVSGRLRSASDLEEKGLIDRSQKGILKDLIICGDEELQQALDQYESGDPTVLEHMIQSGALQSKAVPDLDLLGDLDLDFLNMAGGGELGVQPPENKDGPGMYTLPQQPEQQQAATRASSLPALPPQQQPSLIAGATGKRHASETVVSGMVSPYHDDGIGELEFTGDFSDNGGGGYYGTTEPPPAAATATGAAADPLQQHQHHQFSNPQQQQHSNNSNRQRGPSFSTERLRSGSVFSIDSFADQRWRSNSLFSSLINDPKSSTSESHQELGRWMDRVPVNDRNTTATATATGGLVTTDDGPHHDHIITGTPGQQTAAVSKPIPIPTQPADGGGGEAATGAPPLTAKQTKKKKAPTRRKSDSAAILDRQKRAKLKQELAEQKRREKQEKRAKKEREKQEKKEARLAAKEEKKKLKDQKKQAQQKAAVAAKAMEVDEKPVHVPGSGRPRSMSDPNFKTKRDDFGLVEIERPDGWVGAYSPESRKVRIEKFLAKRHQRVWTKTVKYDVRKNFADSRLRVKGRFVKKEDEMLMRDLMSMT